MVSDGLSSWRAQLGHLRKEVAQAEKERELRKKLERERSRDAVAARLREEPIESLGARFHDLKRECQAIGQRLYPPDGLRGRTGELDALQEIVQYYDICRREYGELFNANMRETLSRLLTGLQEVRNSLEKQLGQWSAIEEVLEKTIFRPRSDADNLRLLEIAKSFSLQAHSLPLVLPADYFATENENFWVAEAQGAPRAYGYVKYWPEDTAISLAVVEPDSVNFKKFVRGFLFLACRRGPAAGRMEELRVRVADPQEFKFFQELGFRRAGGLSCPVCVRHFD